MMQNEDDFSDNCDELTKFVLEQVLSACTGQEIEAAEDGSGFVGMTTDSKALQDVALMFLQLQTNLLGEAYKTLELLNLLDDEKLRVWVGRVSKDSGLEFVKAMKEHVDHLQNKTTDKSIELHEHHKMPVH